MPAPHTPEVIAHRGYAAREPENSLAAFLAAVELGAGGIELDVHATADGVVVVNHDAEAVLDTGRRQPIAGATWAQLAELATDRPVPRLADVLDAVAAHATVYVEIKARQIEERVCAEVARFTDRCAVHSFDHRTIVRCRQVTPAVTRGILMTSYLVDPLAPLRDTGSRDYWMHWDLIDEALVSAVHANDGRVIAWTVNSVDAARRLAGLGVDGLCTDDTLAMQHAFPNPRRRGDS